MLLLLFFVAFEGAAQTSKTDSLLSVVSPESRDTTNIYSMTLLAERLGKEGRFDESLKYSILARKYSEEKNFKSGKARSLLASGRTYKLMGAYQASLNDLQEAVLLFQQLKDLAKAAYTHTVMGNVYEDLSQFDVALEHHRQALSLFSLTSESDGMAHAYNGLGINCYKRGKYTDAVQCYLQALRIADSIQHTSQKATALNNLAVVYEGLKDYRNALLYYKRCLSLMQSLQLQPYIAKTFSNMGGIYIALGQYDSALQHLDSAYQIRLRIGDKHQVYTLTNYGDLYKKKKEFSRAEWYYQQALKCAREINNRETQLFPLKGLGDLYRITKKWAQSREKLDEAYAIAKSIQSNPWLEEIYMLRARLDSATGDFRNALIWNERSHALNDSLFGKIREEAIAPPSFHTQAGTKQFRSPQPAHSSGKKPYHSSGIILYPSIALLLVFIVSVTLYIRKTHPRS